MDVSVSHACAMTGYCTRIAPEVFALEAGAERAVVRVTGLKDLDATLREAIWEAEVTCPAAAIEVLDTEW